MMANQGIFDPSMIMFQEGYDAKIYLSPGFVDYLKSGLTLD